MSLLISPIVELYRTSLVPIAPFTYLGLPISTLDVLGAVRLCLILRQIREINLTQHLRKAGATVEPRSFVRDLTTTLTVVYGGEFVTSPFLMTPPSFIVSPAGTILFALAQYFIDSVPTSLLPALSANTELPFSFLDGLTRAFLLCSAIPPMVTANSVASIASSAWTLLLASLFTANGGFFFANMLSLLSPGPMSFTTPPELGPYGWTTTDLWCAPLITGLYATLTHAQPFWTEIHLVLSEFLGGSLGTVLINEDKRREIAPVDSEVARAACAVILAAMFTVRTVKNFKVELGLGKPVEKAEKVAKGN